MIHHTKLFVRRLAYTPWLLVAGLVLGWAGEAAAQGEGDRRVSVSSTGAREGETMTFEVFLNSAVSGTQQVTVDYSFTGDTSDGANPADLSNDLTGLTGGTLTFSASGVAVVHRINVVTTQDAIDEHDETFTITLSNPVGATLSNTPTGTGTIYDEDLPPALSISDASAYEGSNADFVVTLSAASGKTVKVDYSTSTATAAVEDFTLVTDGTLTFSPGQTLSQVISVSTSEDPTDEDNETFTVTLSMPANATLPTPATATGTILDDDPLPSLALSSNIDSDLSEGGNATFTVTRAGATEREITVDYTVMAPGGEGKASQGDFSTPLTGTLTLSSETTATFTVTIQTDRIGEDAEAFTVMLSSPTNARLGVDAQTVTISADTDPVALSVDDVSVTEDNDAVFTVTKSAKRGVELTVDYVTSPGTATEKTDYEVTKGTLTIKANTKTGTITVQVRDDMLDEVDTETFTLTLSNPSPSDRAAILDGTAIGTITDNDNPPSFSVADASAAEGDSVKFVVKASSGALAAMTVDYTISVGAVGDGRYTAAQANDFTTDAMLSGTLTFAANATGDALMQTVSVATQDDGDDENNENFSLMLSNATIGGTGLAAPTIANASAVGTIIDNDGPPSLSVAAASATEGDTLDFTVTLALTNTMTRSEAVTVAYATSPGTATSADFTAASGMLTFAAAAAGDALMQTVSVATTQDNISEDAETITLTLSSVSANAKIGTGTATGTINDDDGTPMLSVADASATEGSQVTFTVTMSKASPSAVTMDYEAVIAAGNSASQGDLSLGAGTLIISAGQTSGTIPVATTSDLIREANETFTLRLSNLSDNAAFSDATATGTIVDDEAVPAEGDIALTLTPASVREDGGTKTIAVKAAVPAEVTADTYVALSLEAGSDAQLNKRFRIVLPTLTIPKDKKEVSGEITFIPISTDADNSDLKITIVANSGTQLGAATITMIDAHKSSSEITLSFDPASISEEEGPKDITVTATLDGAVQTEALTFALVIDESAATTKASTNAKHEAAVRDVDYSTISLPSLTIPKKSVSGSTVITIDPRSRDRGSLEAVVVGLGARPSALNDGAITIESGTITITDAPLASTKGLTAAPSAIRENLGTQEIALTVELSAALPEDQDVFFTIMDNADGVEGASAAQRDVNYTALVGDLTILAGETKGTTTLTVTTVDNGGSGGPLAFKVRAKAGQTTQETSITIIDDETLSTSIALSVAPAEVKAGTGSNDVTVTGAINSGTFAEDKTMALVLAPKDTDDATAQRDTDYTASLGMLTIPAGELTGSTTISISAINGGDKKVVVKALAGPKNQDGVDVTVSNATITLKDADPAAEPEEPGALRFGADLAATTFPGVIGEEFNQALPEAEGGADERSYSVSANLPAGLLFDEDTRTVSGTPTTVGTARVVYTVIDDEGGSAAVQFTIDVAAAPPPTVAVSSVTVSQQSVRESGSSAGISVTATLAGPAPAGEMVTFLLEAPSSGTEAIRDVDYSASLGGSVAVEAGATEASTTLDLSPIDNDSVDGNKYLGLRASASGGSASVDIKIADDETASTSVSLSASPNTISESAGRVEVEISATLDGKVLDSDTQVTISIDSASKAARDEDYLALFNPRLTIPAGSVSASIALLIEPVADAEEEGSETITLNGVSEGLDVASGTITISDSMMDEDMMDPLAFAEGAMIDAIAATAGTAISDVVLPAAAGGEGDISYSASGLPAGLSFDAATRTLSGTPEAEGSSEVTYTATAGDESVSLTFTITVNAMLDFGDLGSLFGAFEGAGKANPADEHDDGGLQIIVGQPYSLTLPEVSGGTPPLTYSVSGLPAGLAFDSATRTVSGTPTEVTESIAVIYTVTDALGASSSVPFLVAVIEPPLDAPDALIAEDYKGADGAGDQGGFVLLTWDLSEHHDNIDGYRIFRELPVLNNEQVPWAMVDAVPGVQIGRAIVATLDNVATNWGIAAERGGQTTHEAAKAVLVSAENLSQPYAQMAETLMASQEAAQAGDAPVFAALLPEALAYAQGVAPKLNLVGGVLSSEITVTEEPVRAIDNIAPLAVPSLTVLDAPNDQGSRIVLTWTLSPSDQILQGVVAEAIGPIAVESVVGVYGYSIYRRAAGEDEFAKVGQVDAGVASFVDETALNGVHYTYQVRTYDLDNETNSVEQTAMAVRNLVVDSEGSAIFGLFGADSRIGFDDFFLFADSFGLTAEDAGFDPAFDLSPNATIDFDDFFVFADNFGRSTAAAGKVVPMLAGLNADARMYLDARTALPSVGEDFVLDVRVADFAAIKGYGLQVQYEADKLEFVEVLTDQPLGGSELATPQVLNDQEGVLALAAHGDVVSDGEVALSLVFRPTTEIENTIVEITDNQTYDSAFGFNSLALPAPVQVQTRPEVFALANNYPNPFNPATTIKYALPQAADVQLTVYNVLGQPVRMLVAEHQSAGRYVVEWDATNDSGHSLSSGMYFYRLEAGGDLEVKKMLLLK